MISSSYRCQIYVDQLIIGEEMPTTAKVLVGHDMPSVVFNSLEVAQKVDELDGAVRVCPIQSSKVVVVGYLGDPPRPWMFNIGPNITTSVHACSMSTLKSR